MTLLGIKANRGSGGSVKEDRVEPLNEDDNHPEDKLYSSARQLPVAAVCPEPDDVERALFRRRLNRPRIPLVIKCGRRESPPSSPMMVQKKISPLNFLRDRQQSRDNKEDPKYECLRLLESDMYEDNRLGIEQLVVIVNRELVNSKTEGSIAEALIYSSKEDDDFSKRIRVIFPTFFTDDFLHKSFRENKKPITNNKIIKDSETQESGSTDETSMYSDLSNSTGKRYRRSMKLPALRVLVSSMELLSRKRKKSPLKVKDPFWKCMLAYMMDSLNLMHLERVESSLCIKGLRLLYKLDSSALQFKEKESVMPLIVAAKEHGRQDRDKMLVRECDRFLKILTSQ